jgi:beta-glucuronidase
LLWYEGTIWYKRDFDYRMAVGRRVYVYFGAANYDAKVYLNGTKLGEHQGGFTPFCFEITDRLRERDNFLVVKVDNQRRPEAVPTVNTDWWNYGGLTRDVMLVDVPETFVRDYFIQLARGAGSEVAGWLQLSGPEAEQQVTVQIPEIGAQATVRTNQDGYAEFSFPAELERWSPSSPRLYGVEIRAQNDHVRDRVGFRTIEVQGLDILLNGQPVFLRGISIHEQAPLRLGRAWSEADARTLLGWAQELGANFVRLAHYPHNRHMARLADELGLLVWAEIPVYWTILWDNPATLHNAQQQLAELIGRDKNRASVIIWSLGNETPPGPARLRFMIELARAARQLDPSRLLSAALERRATDEHTQLICDPLGDYLDVIGCNEYLGWYSGLPEQAEQTSWRSSHHKPLIISEFGAGALQGYHADPLTRWTEEYQASVYRYQVRMLERIPFLRGLSPWVLADFRSPRRPLPRIQDYWNRKGLISDQGKKKQAYYVLQQYYQKLAASSSEAKPSL